MATYGKAQLAIPQVVDVNGAPAVGYTIYSYVWDTSTPLSMYTDSNGSGAATSFTLNSLGQPQNGGGTAVDIFLKTGNRYKFIIKDADGAQVGATIGPVDPDVYFGVIHASNYSTLADAVTAAAGKELVITENTVVASNTTVSGCSVKFIFPGNIDPSTGIAVTFSPKSFRGCFNCFDSTAAGTFAGTFAGQDLSVDMFGGGADSNAATNLLAMERIRDICIVRDGGSIGIEAGELDSTGLDI